MREESERYLPSVSSSLQDLFAVFCTYIHCSIVLASTRLGAGRPPKSSGDVCERHDWEGYVYPCARGRVGAIARRWWELRGARGRPYDRQARTNGGEIRWAPGRTLR
jgi:hypothetical protein